MKDTSPLIIPRGFRAGAVKAGIKPSGGLDLALLVADGPCAAAGTFTTNRVCAAPVKWCRDRLPAADIRAVVINAGNANAATGSQGAANVGENRPGGGFLAGMSCRPGPRCIDGRHRPPAPDGPARTRAGARRGPALGG